MVCPDFLWESDLKKIVFTFGVLGGLIAISLMLVSMSLESKASCGSTTSMVIGYTILVACAFFVFFGVKSYRDNVATGSVTFGKALWVGVLISLVASVCYVAGWELFDHFVKHQNMDGYFNAMQEQARAAHLSAEKLQAKLADIEESRKRYNNLFWNAAYTLLEPLLVLLMMSVLSAAILRRKPQQPGADAAVAIS